MIVSVSGACEGGTGCSAVSGCLIDRRTAAADSRRSELRRRLRACIGKVCQGCMQPLSPIRACCGIRLAPALASLGHSLPPHPGTHGHGPGSDTKARTEHCREKKRQGFAGAGSAAGALVQGACSHCLLCGYQDASPHVCGMHALLPI